MNPFWRVAWKSDSHMVQPAAVFHYTIPLKIFWFFELCNPSFLNLSLPLLFMFLHDAGGLSLFRNCPQYLPTWECAAAAGVVGMIDDAASHSSELRQNLADKQSMILLTVTVCHSMQVNTKTSTPCAFVLVIDCIQVRNTFWRLKTWWKCLPP